MSSTPVRDAASISITSTWRSSALAGHCAHRPQGSAVAPPEPSGPTQLRARARMRAVVVLPTPRTPVRMKACAIRPVAIAFDSVRTIASCPISSAKVEGRYLRARTRYAAVESLILETVSRQKGDRTNDPDRGSLRLLPSGPDRVGEGPVRRRPPLALYQQSAMPGQAPHARRPLPRQWRMK